MTYAGRHSQAGADPLAHGGHVTGTVLLRAEHLVMTYGSTVAVDDVELVLNVGDLVAVTGSSGAGKTSLLAMLAGTSPPTHGSVTRADAAVVVIAQDHELAAMLTAIENVALPLLVSGRSGADARGAAESVMAALGVQDAAGQLVDELSGGQQQRVAVARGLVQHAAVLLADEPTSELDSGNRNVVLGLLRDEAQRGAAVLVATNDPAVAELCDAELRLDQGRGRWVRDDRR